MCELVPTFTSWNSQKFVAKATRSIQITTSFLPSEMSRSSRRKIAANVTCVFLRVASVILHFLMTPFVVRQSEDRVDAVPRRAACWLRQDDVLTVLRGGVDQLLRVHRWKSNERSWIQLPFGLLARSWRRDLVGDPSLNALLLNRDTKWLSWTREFRIHFEGGCSTTRFFLSFVIAGCFRGIHLE